MAQRFSGIPWGALFPILVMAALAGMTTWLITAVRNAAPAPPQPLKHEPDYVVNQFRLVRLNNDGTLKVVMQGERYTHYPDNDLAKIEKLVMTRYPEPEKPVPGATPVSATPAGASPARAAPASATPASASSSSAASQNVSTGKLRAPTRIRADEAYLVDSGNEARLYGNVIAHRPAFGDRQAFTAATSYAQYVADFNLLRTPEVAKIFQGATIVRGKGMEYDDITKEWRVLSDIQAVFEKKEKGRAAITVLPPDFQPGKNPDYGVIPMEPLPPVNEMLPPRLKNPLPNPLPAGLLPSPAAVSTSPPASSSTSSPAAPPAAAPNKG
jgi:lipopolysaccharide export system protein LptC